VRRRRERRILTEAAIMVIFDNPATVPAPAGQYSHVAYAELGDKTLLQLSGQAAIDAAGARARVAGRFAGSKHHRPFRRNGS
jgi:hypothetical protein